MMEKSGQVSYNVDRIPHCDNPSCDTRRTYGICVSVEEIQKILGVIPYKSSVNKKNYCPKHAEDRKLAKKARQKEHAKARSEYEELKDSKRREKYKSVREFDFLPVFKYKRGTLYRKNGDRFYAEVGDFDDAVEFFNSSRPPCPILLISKHDHEFAIIDNGELIRNSYEDDPDLEEIRSKYQDTKYLNRSLYSVRTNSLTGKSADIPVHDIEQVADEVIEWNEYEEPQGRIDIKTCPCCGREGRRVRRYIRLSRICLDGEEKIMPVHTRGKCRRIMGEINPRFIDEEAYDLRSKKNK